MYRFNTTDNLAKSNFKFTVNTKKKDFPPHLLQKFKQSIKKVDTPEIDCTILRLYNLVIDVSYPFKRQADK